MRLVVLGGTGQTGKEVVQQALDAGHSVTTVVRDPTKITTSHQNLNVVKGDIFDKSALTSIIADHDAVVSCLGFPRNPKPVTGYIESAKAVISAMREANVRRIVAMTAWYTETSSASRMGFLTNWVLVPILRPMLINMREMENFFDNSCPDINYTVVRPPRLSQAPKTGLEMTVKEDFIVETGTGNNSVTRGDVAAFMLSCLNTQQYDQKMVAISTQKALK